MLEIKPGDRVAMYNNGVRHTGRVISAFMGPHENTNLFRCQVTSLYPLEYRVVHRKQMRKIKKKEP